MLWTVLSGERTKTRRRRDGLIGENVVKGGKVCGEVIILEEMFRKEIIKLEKQSGEFKGRWGLYVLKDVPGSANGGWVQSL